MKIRKAEILVFILVLISFAMGLYFYSLLPDQLVSHWDASGNPNDYMTRFWGTFLMPIIGSIMFIVFLVVPRIDPKRANIEKFINYFDGFIVLLFLFLLYLYGLTIAWNLGNTFNFILFIIPAFLILFFYIGILVGHAKPNWTIGIRTPWTLSNENVWNKTHHLGSLMFKISAIIGLFGLIFVKYAVWIVVIPVLFTALYTVVYSYLAYRKEMKK